jgi:hypothetical protein
VGVRRRRRRRRVDAGREVGSAHGFVVRVAGDDAEDVVDLEVADAGEALVELPHPAATRITSASGATTRCTEPGTVATHGQKEGAAAGIS